MLFIVLQTEDRWIGSRVVLPFVYFLLWEVGLVNLFLLELLCFSPVTVLGLRGCFAGLHVQLGVCASVPGWSGQEQSRHLFAEGGY